MKIEEKDNSGIITDTEKNSTNEECKNIGSEKKWIRNCPECGKQLFYNSKRWYYTNEKYKKLCRSCVRKVKKLYPPSRKGVIMSDDQKEKIRISHLGKPSGMLGKHHSEETKIKFKNRINPMLGKHHSLEIRLKISKTRKKNKIPGPIMSNDGLRRLRMKRIKEIEKDKFNGNQIIPSFNKKSCEFFNKLNKELKLNGKFATNGGEYQIKELGYFVDYYDENKNLIIEWDERNHYNVDGSLKDNDIKRENEIKNHLKCKFYRIKETVFNEEEVIRKINEYITN